MKSWEETDGEAEQEERQTDSKEERQAERKTGEDVKQVADGEQGREGGGGGKRGV